VPHRRSHCAHRVWCRRRASHQHCFSLKMAEETSKGADGGARGAPPTPPELMERCFVWLGGATELGCPCQRRYRDVNRRYLVFAADRRLGAGARRQQRGVAVVSTSMRSTAVPALQFGVCYGTDNHRRGVQRTEGEGDMYVSCLHGSVLGVGVCVHAVGAPLACFNYNFIRRLNLWVSWRPCNHSRTCRNIHLLSF
jgi:hypothetical protein